MQASVWTAYTLATAVVSQAPAPAAKPVENSLGMKFVRIEPGAFLMGEEGPLADYAMQKHPAKCDDSDFDEAPAHKAILTQPFLLATTETTLGQYRKFKPGYRPKGGDDEASVGMSWHDAAAFCAWLSQQEGETYRLPTEAEWEYACRAGTKTLYSHGDRLPAGEQTWFGDGKRRRLYFADSDAPPEYRLDPGPVKLTVATHAPNAWGLYDMHGNVSEWCADWYGPYDEASQTNPLGPADGDFRVFRGGSHSQFARLLRSANRSGWIPEGTGESVGFRVVRGALPTSGSRTAVRAVPQHAKDVDQTALAVAAPTAEAALYSGPKPIVTIPAGSFGPMYSRHNHSPAVAECPNGDLLATWFSCVDEGGSELCNLASRLRRGQAEWEPASPFWDGPDVNDHAPKLWWDGDRTLHHFARGLSENIHRTSTDNGATWSKAKVVHPNGEYGTQLLRARDGVLHFTHDVRSVSLVSSRDGGANWSSLLLEKQDADVRPGATAHRPPGIHAGLVDLADGSLLAFSRLDPPEEQALFHVRTPQSLSRDGGKTWELSESPFPAISSAQRAVLIRLKEGPLLFCSFTDQSRDWRTRKGLPFPAADGAQTTGFGLFAALSFDEGKSWPTRRLVTPGGLDRKAVGIDDSEFTLGETMAEPKGYLAAVQTRDGRIQLVTSKNHYVFNLAWLKENPSPAAK